MRRNPLNVNDEPDGRGVLAVGALSLLLLAVGAAVVDRNNAAWRTANVERVLAARGFEAVEVERIWRSAGCGRASGGFRWRAASGHGTACAGPGERVEIRAARDRDERPGG